MRENNSMQGRLTLQMSDRDNRIVYRIQRCNRIVSGGRDLVARLFSGQAGGVPITNVTHMALGTDGTEPSDADTALGAERAPRRQISNVVHSTFTQPDSVNRSRVQLTSIFDFDDANGVEPLREAGIFTADAAGTLYSRVVFEGVTKTNAFKLTLLWDIDF